MATEMEERVAKAMAIVDKMDEGRWEYLLPHARAAIEAMREPSESMKSAPTWYDGDKNFTPGDAEAVWDQMIDAALGKAEA